MTSIPDESYPLVTIAIIPRERFSFARESLESIFENTTDLPFALVYIDGGGPAALSECLEDAANKRNFTLVRTPGYLSPNQARNLALTHVRTPYVVFCDNDVVPAPGWLSAMLGCAIETGAAIVTPLTCEGQPIHTTIHCAGGEARIIEQEHDGKSVRFIHETLLHQKSRLEDQRSLLSRVETELAEFHCMLVRTDIFEAVGSLDEEFLNTKEHLDFCLLVRQRGERIFFEPASLVTYIFNRPLERGDHAFFMLRWSDEWETRSLRRFMQKWRLAETDYFRNRIRNRGWRRKVAIWRPLARRLTFGTLGRVLGRAMFAVDRVVYNALLTSRYRRRLAIDSVPVVVHDGRGATRRFAMKTQSGPNGAQ